MLSSVSEEKKMGTRARNVNVQFYGLLRICWNFFSYFSLHNLWIEFLKEMVKRKWLNRQSTVAFYFFLALTWLSSYYVTWANRHLNNRHLNKIHRSKCNTWAFAMRAIQWSYHMPPDHVRLYHMKDIHYQWK